MRRSRRRISVTRSVASLRRVCCSGVLGRPPRSSAAAVAALNPAGAPPGMSWVSSVWSRLIVWVRARTRSSRCSTSARSAATASSTCTVLRCPAVIAAMPTEIASASSVSTNDAAYARTTYATTSQPSVTVQLSSRNGNASRPCACRRTPAVARPVLRSAGHADATLASFATICPVTDALTCAISRHVGIDCDVLTHMAIGMGRLIGVATRLLSISAHVGAC